MNCRKVTNNKSDDQEIVSRDQALAEEAAAAEAKRARAETEPDL